MKRFYRMNDGKLAELYLGIARPAPNLPMMDAILVETPDGSGIIFPWADEIVSDIKRAFRAYEITDEDLLFLEKGPEVKQSWRLMEDYF